MSLRVNVQDGKATVDGSLKYVDGDPRTGKQPSVAAAAYTNSVAGSQETAFMTWTPPPVRSCDRRRRTMAS